MTSPNSLRKLPIGIQDFAKLRNENFLYADKTAILYKLVNEATTYFLSRPRRFGKSILCSTLAAYFRGQKELFKGLAIEHTIFWVDLNNECVLDALPIFLEQA